MKKLYLVDVSSMFFRAFYAIRQLSNPQGLPTNAIYGFLAMTIKLLRESKPDYMAFCFDRPEPSFRKDLDPRYKANRSEMPEDLVPQIPYIRRLADALGILCLDKESFEADDVIGTLAHWARNHKLDVVIVSGDKDFGQLVGPHVSMYDTMKDVSYDESGVLEKWGVRPDQVIDYLALVGDSSDNIPGVSGIGPKGAQKLLAEFQTLDGVYAHLEKIKSASTVKKLQEGRDEAYLSRRLVTICLDVPLSIELDDLRLKPIVREKLQALLQELDFKNFAKQLLGETAAASASSVRSDSPAVATNVESATAQEESSTEASLREQRMGLTELQNWLQPSAETWGFLTERGLYIAQSSTIVEVAGDVQDVKKILNTKDVLWKGFHLKELWKFLDLDNPRIAWDAMLAAYVVRAGSIESPLPLFQLYNGVALPELASPAQLLNAHLQLEVQLTRKLKSLGMESILYEIEQPIEPILYQMERYGVRIDAALLRSQSEDLGRDLRELEKQIHHDAGTVFNIGSPKQLAQVLFEKLKAPTGKKTKTGFSTDNEVLEKLLVDFPIAAKILQYRELSKLKSTYVDALPNLCNPETGRVHTTFNQALTTTGRLSSTNPNVQNIPIRTERGNLVRKAFIASPGCLLLSADYSQIELRVLAHIAEDAALIQAFERDLDIHTATASEVFGVSLKEVSPEMRRKAKAVNFGLAYGQGAFGLAENLQIPRSEASEIIQRYFTRFSGVKTYMSDIVETAKKQGYVETIFGRRRYVDELFSKNAAIKKFGERAAINAPIQGTASDLVKKAMIHVSSFEKMILQVHDELIFEVPESQAEDFSKKIRTKMETVAQLRVPLKVNIGIGPSWYDAH